MRSMFGRYTRFLGITLTLIFSLAILTFSRSNAGDRIREGDTVKIGLVRSLFSDMPETAMRASLQPFGIVMKAQTGVNGEIVPGGDAQDLGRLIAEGKIHLGVFHGIEYAWAHMRYPEIRPLVVAVNHHRHLRAHLVVNREFTAKLGDLRGTTLAVPKKSREHCMLFLEHRCRICGYSPPSYFAKTTNPANAVDALDDVVDGIAQVTVVDAVALNWFEQQKPGRFAKLRILQTSEPFPCGAIVYRPGIIDEATLEKFRSGMINANKTILGRELLTLWHLSGFEPVPPDYEQTLAEIVKVYPPPAGPSK
jgi:ABC-type phosphate/phosphonate transport system substrate-binding protein